MFSNIILLGQNWLCFKGNELLFAENTIKLINMNMHMNI